MYHRLYGPAIEHKNFNKSWYKNGNWHREDGPAVEFSEGFKFWYIDGIEYTEEEYNRAKNEI